MLRLPSLHLLLAKRPKKHQLLRKKRLANLLLPEIVAARDV